MEIANLLKFFANFDKGSGFVPMEDMQKILLSAKIPSEVCKSIWDLANPNGLDKFSKQMFLVTMTLINKYKKGMPLPKTLP